MNLPEADHLSFQGACTPEPVTWKGPGRLAFLWDGLSLALSIALISKYRDM